MEDYLGPVGLKPDLFLKLTKRISNPEYTMNFMEDRNGRKAMFYITKGQSLMKVIVFFLKQRLQNID